MKRLYLNLELLSDAVLSASGATSGGHRCLPFVPGAALLGVASSAYMSLGARAFDTFHSGRVRFLPGYPADGAGRGAVPLPLSFHCEKYPTSWSPGAGRLPVEPCPDLQNLALGDPSRMDRADALPTGFLWEDGRLAASSRRVLLKTAVAPETGRADDGQLFAYEAVTAGARFAAEVHIDDDVDAEVEAAIVQALTADVIGIGRSRSAEFGRARAWQVKPPDPRRMEQGGDGPLLIYCLTDLALDDPETGQPTLTPSPGHFGLPDGARIDPARTFARWRRYSPVNGKRARPDLERQVLVRGSVIAFDVPGGVDEAELVSSLDRGVGMYRQDGLGQVLVRPWFVAQNSPAARSGGTSAAQKPPPPPDGPFIGWLEQRVAAHDRQERAYLRACAEANAFVPHARARGGPGRAQWGMLREQAALASNAAELRRRLLGDDKEKGLLYRGVRGEAWKIRRKGKQAVELLAEFIDKTEDDLLVEALQILASQVTRHMSGERDA